MPFGFVGSKAGASFSALAKASGIFTAAEVHGLTRAGGWHAANLAKRLLIPAPPVTPVNQGNLVGTWMPILHPNGRLAILVNTLESRNEVANYSNAPPLIAVSLNGAAPTTILAFAGSPRYQPIQAALSPDGAHFYVQFYNAEVLVYDCDGSTLTNPRAAFASGAPRVSTLGYPNGADFSYPRTDWSADGKYLFGIGTSGARTQAATRNAATGALTSAPTLVNSAGYSESDSHGVSDWYGNGNQFNMYPAPSKKQVFSFGNKGSSNYCVQALGPCDYDAGQLGTRQWNGYISSDSTRQVFSPQWSSDSKYLFVLEGTRGAGTLSGALMYLTTNLAGNVSTGWQRLDGGTDLRFSAFACTDTEVWALTTDGRLYAYRYSDGSFARRTVPAAQLPNSGQLPYATMHTSVGNPKNIGFGKINTVTRPVNVLRVGPDTNPAFV